MQTSSIGMIPLNVIMGLATGFSMGSLVGYHARWYVAIPVTLCSFRVARHARPQQGRHSTKRDVSNAAVWSSFSVGVFCIWATRALAKAPKALGSSILSIVRKITG
eukprot:TRINITY_DN1190_c3_g1_i1.p1 TRINITY_DN1190_c3_g1~~TRINITY_DN1190_c3_g1_i1.p1  ORF type:complete len:121 (+),score=12.66 TRINITY_DN1190_c3_g1_i1:48-365(+)